MIIKLSAKTDGENLMRFSFFLLKCYFSFRLVLNPMNIHNKKKIPWIFNNEINKWWVLYEWLSGIVDYVSSSSLRIHDISILFVSNKVDVAHALDLLFCHLLMNNNIRCIINIKYLDFSLTRTRRIKMKFLKMKSSLCKMKRRTNNCAKG